MNRAMRFIEILWLAVAAVSVVEIVKSWGDWNTTLKFTLFLGVAVFMYFFRRKNRIRHISKGK